MYTHVCTYSERAGGRETEREGRKEGGKGMSIAETERRVVSKERQGSREGPNDRLKGKGKGGREHYMASQHHHHSKYGGSILRNIVNIVNGPLQGSISSHRCRSWSGWSGLAGQTFWMR